MSHWAIAIFSVWAGAWSTILYYAHIDLGWLFYIQGVLLTPAVMPIAFTVLWKKQSKHAAFWGTITGTICGLSECHLSLNGNTVNEHYELMSSWLDAYVPS